MKRLIVLLLGALALCLPPAPAAAQTVSAKTVTACGTPGNTPVVGVPYPVTQDTTGVLCTSATGGGGVAGFTAAAAPFAVSAGTNKPAGEDSANSAQFFEPVKPGTTTTIDLSAPSGVLGTNGTGIATTANPFDVEINGAIPAGANLIGGVQGAAANAASVAGNPLLEGCRGATAAPTAVTDGQVATAQCTADGKRVMLPYAIKELAVRGSSGAIANTSQTSIIASAGGSLKNYITAIQCANSGATTSILTFTDAAATVLINPAGGGGSWVFPVPLATAAATAFQVTPGSSSTSQYCSAQGYTGL